jgi:hypothetical protein
MVGMPARVVRAPQCSIRVAPALPPPWLREKHNALPHKFRTSALHPIILQRKDSWIQFEWDYLVPLE